MTLGRRASSSAAWASAPAATAATCSRALGQRAFNDLVRYAFDQGITFSTTPRATLPSSGSPASPRVAAGKALSPVQAPDKPEDVLKTIDRHRQVFDTNYVDSLLIHCMVKDGWTGEYRRMMDRFEEAKARGWIRAKGVSCHSLPALRTAVASDWPDVHLVRVNPQANHIDGPEETWNKPGKDIAPVVGSSVRCTPRAEA